MASSSSSRAPTRRERSRGSTCIPVAPSKPASSATIFDRCPTASTGESLSSTPGTRSGHAVSISPKNVGNSPFRDANTASGNRVGAGKALVKLQQQQSAKVLGARTMLGTDETALYVQPSKSQSFAPRRPSPCIALMVTVAGKLEDGPNLDVNCPGNAGGPTAELSSCTVQGETVDVSSSPDQPRSGQLANSSEEQKAEGDGNVELGFVQTGQLLSSVAEDSEDDDDWDLKLDLELKVRDGINQKPSLRLAGSSVHIEEIKAEQSAKVATPSSPALISSGITFFGSIQQPKVSHVSAMQNVFTNTGTSY